MIQHMPEVSGSRRIRRLRPSAWLYSSTDYVAGELFTHAQSCIWIVGKSDLATALLTGKDPHSVQGAAVLKITYEEFFKNKKQKKIAGVRQAVKPIVFGKPGGMGDAKLVKTQRKQGPDTVCENGNAMVDDGEDEGNLVPGYKGMRFCILMGADDRCGRKMVQEWGRPGYERECAPTCLECLQCASEISQNWKVTWRENTPYFKHTSSVVDNGELITGAMLERWPRHKPWFRVGQRMEPGQMVQHFSMRVRQVIGDPDDSPFCACSNGYFQSLLAEIMKRAYWRATRECYDRSVRVPMLAYANSRPSRYRGGPSPLLGSRIPGFFHDEAFAHHPADTAVDAATRIGEIQEEEMMMVCPDVAAKVKAEPALMTCWDKRAEPVRHLAGLQVWTPDHNPKKCTDCQAYEAAQAALVAA